MYREMLSEGGGGGGVEEIRSKEDLFVFPLKTKKSNLNSMKMMVNLMNLFACQETKTISIVI